MTDYNKAVYVLGGMGPQASVLLYETILRYAHDAYGAINNDDYPEVIVHSLPVPDFINDTRQISLARSLLIRAVQNMPKYCQAFTLACNTAHLLEKELITVTEVPFISMIDCVVDEVVQRGATSVAVLASNTTICLGLYHKKLESVGVKVVDLTDTEIVCVDKAIQSVISFGDLDKEKKALDRVITGLLNRSAELVILGCTELPVIYATHTTTNLVSSTECLAKEIVNRFYSSKI